MQAKSILTTAALVLAALFILDVPAANGQPTWTGTDNANWSDPDNWDTSGGGTAPPAVGDSPIIPDVTAPDDDPVLDGNVTITGLTIQNGGYLCTVGNALTITGSGGLTISAGGWLHVNHADGEVALTGGGTHHINRSGETWGELRLSCPGSTLSISSSNAEISWTGAAGKIVGQSNTARITVADSKTLTNQITIAGAMEIRAGSGTFFNGATGLVHANRTTGDRVLTLYSGTFDDADGAEWKVSANATAELYFSADITVDGTLDGDFTVSNGILALDLSVTTNGGLCFTGGRIEVAPGCTFTASGVHPSCP